MKVAILIQHGTIGGIEMHALALAQGLAERGDTPIIVMQFSGGPLLKLLDRYNIRSTILGGKNGHDPLVAFRLFTFLRNESPDVLHVHAVSLAAALTLQVLRNTKVVATEHMSKLGRRVPPKSQLLWRLLYFRAAKVICVSNSTKEAVLDIFPKLAPRVETIYNGIPVKATDPTADHDRTLPIKSSGEVVVGAVGRLADGKGWMEFLDIAKELSSTHPHVTFQVIGDGPSYKALVAQSQQLGVAGSVKFMGYRSNPRELIKNMDAYLLLSEHEACPLTLIEAFAEKTPVTGFLPLGGVSEINGGISPLIAKRNTSSVVKVLSELLEHESKRKHQAHRAYKRFLENYTQDIMVTKIRETYQSVLAS